MAIIIWKNNGSALLGIIASKEIFYFPKEAERESDI
jgi:hypothetical protein